MNVKNLHISYKLELDKIDSGLYDNLLDNEIDYYFNKAQIEFIKSRYNPDSNQYRKGFEMNEKRTVDLKNLHVTNYSDTCYLTSEDNKYRFTLPSDFMFLTSEQAKVYYNYCNTITYTTNTEVKTYFKIPLNFSTLTTDNFVNFRIAIGNTSTLLYTPISGYMYPEDEDAYINYIKSLNITDYNIFYENFYTEYEQGSLFIETTQVNDVFISYDNGDTWEQFTSSNLTLESRDGLTNGTQDIVPVRRSQIDDIYVLLKDSFAKPNPESPLAIEHSNYIDSFATNEFIIEDLIISYIRIPKSISLSLNQTSELTSTVHIELIAMAVNMTLEAIESRRYQTNSEELKKIE